VAGGKETQGAQAAPDDLARAGRALVADRAPDSREGSTQANGSVPYRSKSRAGRDHLSNAHRLPMEPAANGTGCQWNRLPMEPAANGTGCQWNQLPKELGDERSIHRTFQRWERVGVFDEAWVTLLQEGEGVGGVAWHWPGAEGRLGKSSDA